MSDLLRTLAAYVPPNIARTTLSAAFPEPPTRAAGTLFPGAVLFADVSGFTPLTEALAQKGAEGPEELTRLLNGYFSRMIAITEAQGGEVVKFSGDAVTVVFPAADEALGVATRRALQTAEAMQAAMSDFATLDTSVGPVELGMKIAIGAGEVLAAQVGGVRNRWEYVVAGDPLRQVAQAEHQAARGEIALSPEAEAIVASKAYAPRPLAQPDWSRAPDPAAAESVLRAFVPSVVSTWLEEALQDWLAVLRPMSVLFIGLGGIDYAATNAVEQLDTFLRAVQETTNRFEGSINKLAVDDKGTVLLILFGAPPRAHEDDPERAVRCAMELQNIADTQRLRMAIGVCTGRVFAGPVGAETRREYTVMGDTVNLSARLMSMAGRGRIFCDYETYRQTRAKLSFESLPPARVKGKAGHVRIYQSIGESNRVSEAKASSVFVGRKTEAARLATALDEVQAGGNRILLIEGEAGIGKSRLMEELVRLMHERGVAGLIGMGRSIEQQTPYRAWRDIFSSYFDLDEVDNPAERQRRVRDQVLDVAPELAERLPLLNDVLNLGLAENALTASLDTQLRYESLVSLLLTLLRKWADERPLVLVLEDAHWLDSLSWDLTVQVARALTVARVPLLLMVLMRPLEGHVTRAEPQTLADMGETEHLLLGSMSPEETLALAATKLGLTDGRLPEAVAELVQDRAAGNPFFAEELVYALRDSGLVAVLSEEGQTLCVVTGDLNQAAQSLPDTIQGIVLSRIDRLPPEEQLTLKVAAVIGRTFGYTPLHDTLGKHMEISHRLLRVYLDDLSHMDLTPLEAPEPELMYIFKHIITQEVAYETLLFAQRRQLHRSVARWYEHTYGGGADQPLEDGPESALAPYYPLLVYHWHQAEDRGRERHYAGLAGTWAAAHYANLEAAGYFSRALELTPETDLEARYKLLLAREPVNDLRGERKAQADDLRTLAELAEEMNDDQRKSEVALRQAKYYEATSDYTAALEAVMQAIEQAARTPELADDAEGYIIRGHVLVRQGDFEAARPVLDHALTLARATHDRQGEAQSLYYLGDVCLIQGDFPAAQEHYQQALEIYRTAGYHQGEADSLIVLGVVRYESGDYPAARDYYEQALSIQLTMGDRRSQTWTLSNLGTVYCDLGDYTAARDYHQQARDLRITIGDRWGEAVSLVNLGLVHHYLGDDQNARAHCERSLGIFREVGDPRGQGYSLTYLGHALAGLGALDAAAEAYKEAVRLRRELGRYSLIIDDWAGLASVAMAQGRPDEALERVEDMLSWIEVNGLEGIDYPLQVYLTCYQVLLATAKGDPAAVKRAYEILAVAHTLLMKKASSIRDETLRLKFLENVEAHREITAAWESREPLS